MLFSNTHWPQLIIPFYSILFATSFFQDISSEASPIILDKFGEHLTRDQRPFLRPESLQILQIHSFFSSVHLTHVLQGSGRGTGTASRSLVLFSVAHFCFEFDVCLWIIVLLEDPTTAHCKISSMDRQFYIFICWYLIESLMP